MRKADLFDELRAEIGAVSDRCSNQIETLYHFVCEILVQRVNDYNWSAIYLTDEYSFYLCSVYSNNYLPEVIPFGEDFLSVVAARGEVVIKHKNEKTGIYVPFYRGHHLVGVLMVEGSNLDAEDVALLEEIGLLFQTKVT
ncbi:hypothetical protein [Thermoactinomyces mirandus]|uniref:GAF domain-containing protein n=1 Tax=Thermoactinomyces mirandus TaxID=2756294 RepID=A0A7W2AR57_9BACL|nr:hypothetical protein [Thermoactinomyces mirandus]MBA4601206.1 hypothetical protein [Thermoactinomyces mirandus]